MLTCSNCGARVREGARFCTSCGTRLNEPAEPATNDWSAEPTETSEPASSDWAATPGTPAGTAEGGDSATTDTSVWESIRQEVTSESNKTTSGPTNKEASAVKTGHTTGTGTGAVEDAATEDNQAGATDESSEEETFSWSWNAPSHEEEEAGSTSGTGASPTADDGTDGSPEAENLDTPADGEASFTGGGSVDADEPETGDDDAIEEAAQAESGGDESDDQETLAAWATQWDTPADTLEGDTGESAHQPEPAATASVTDDGSRPAKTIDNEDEEDTIGKAERLIGELRAIIPALARPKPARPSLARDPRTLADDLDNAAKVGAWDDLRAVLLNARDNPRDIDNMLKLAGNVDEMLELLDDRNNLAKTATNVAAQLREPADRSGEL